MLKIVWVGGMTNDEFFQRAKEESLIFKILKNKHHSRIGHVIRHNGFVVNILEGPISGKKAVGRPRLQYLMQVASNTDTAIKRVA